MKQPSTLHELVDVAIQHHGTSARQLALKAPAAGHQIVYGTLNQIRNGTYKSTPCDCTIRAIAWLAGVNLEAGSHDIQDRLQANSPSKRTLRVVGPSGEVGHEQKIPHPDDSDFEIPPPIGQLAAHPSFKTHHEKFDEVHGERGEKNQDPDF
ncbi:hypothetical protein BLJ79_05040 [Arthrobacter sp. UCD-GKA]|uniref:hypothetical protein n=1 Tax=Arthrobacter sp. UCD-GKA TaxID=1913576 RepID=UPI0008DDD9B3|nr:hypothetical protein [Arthrobacter sp. UCD-GKA]OIH86153.1 hypothetical protein BLJ79_05040 [Arthrobacter sp. UCD-GKA]